MASLLSAIALLLCLATATAADLHVALNGSDANPGTAAKPFATLEHARDAARQAAGSTVFVHRGTWERTATFQLTAADSGTTWRAAPGEEVRLSGGRSVPAGAWQPVDDPAVLERLDPAARGKVLRADLHALGIGELGALPATFRGAPPAPELFFNDVRCTLARWPNQGWATIAKIIEPGAMPREGDRGTAGGVFEYSGERPARWRAENGVWLRGYWCFDWYEETIRVKSIDPATRRITLAAPSLYSVKMGNPSPRRWYALGLLEELDQPGEYAIDRAAGVLYFWPPKDTRRARVVLSTLSAPVVALQNCSRVALRGFVVETGLGNGIEVTGGSGARIEACQVRNLRQSGIVVRGGDHHRVEACDIHDTGTGGLTLEGGDRRALTSAGHAVVNCHIHHYSVHQFTYASAIHLAGVGNLAAHNLIHDAPHMAIGIGGNDHIVEYNIIHDVTTQTDDSGALYKGRDPSCRGNVIRYNFWHHIGSPLGHGTAAVYFDDGDGGDQVLGNLFYQCGDPGRGSFGTVFSHGGHDLLAEGNVFIECKRPLGSAPWNDKRWADAMRDPDWLNKLLKQVDITQPPFTTRYPALVGFMQPQPGVPRVSRAVRNVLVGCGETKSGNWQVDPAENWITAEDPGFVDAAHGDFRFGPDAAVFRHLPAFAPIPFERIGLYADALRPDPPVEHWTGGPLRPLPVRTAAAAAAAPARKGPAPVFKVPRRSAAIQLDGALDPAEWGGAQPAGAMLLKANYTGGEAPQARWSRAWLAWDSDALYVAVDNAVARETQHDGNQWGSNDAVEVSCRAAAGPITVVRLFGNGFVQLGTTPNSGEEPKAMDASAIGGKAAAPAPGRWTAELRIPFHALGVDPAPGLKLAFSLAVRKTRDDLWLMWEPTLGNSFAVERAGFIELSP